MPTALPAHAPVLLVDVGGVLLLHNHELLLPIVARHGGVSTVEEFQRAHFACHHEARPSSGPGTNYFDIFGDHARIPADNRAAFDEEYRAFHRIENRCNWPDPAAKQTLRELVDDNVPVAVVSQADGTIAQMLRTAQMCQVGEGPGVPVDTIVDSQVVGFNKPDPQLFQYALDQIGAQPAQAVHVGDTVRADVRGAQAAGITAIHYDPFDNCDDEPGDHAHIRTLSEIRPVLAELGARLADSRA